MPFKLLQLMNSDSELKLLSICIYSSFCLFKHNPLMDLIGLPVKSSPHKLSRFSKPSICSIWLFYKERFVIFLYFEMPSKDVIS